MNMESYLNLMRIYNDKVTSNLIKILIKDYYCLHREMAENFLEYKAKDLEILDRKFTDPDKINNKLINDYRGEIIDQAVGYLFGKPITYTINKTHYDKDLTAYETANKTLMTFLKKNQIENADAETCKRAGICGVCPRLLYIDTTGQERVMELNPWETIVIYDASLDEVQYAMRYYNVEVYDDKGSKRIRTKVEWYDKVNVTFYIQDNSKEYVLDENVPENPKKHMFDSVPIIEFKNNDEYISDFYKVESLIDAYDRTLSDAQNELEEFRQAYMILENVEITKETLIAARQTGAISIPAGGKAYFLTKEIIDTFIENHKKTLRDNIYRFSKTIDMNAETFTGSGASGEARKWLMTPLEFRCSIKQMKFSKALYEMFTILCGTWNKKGIKISPDNINYSFDRNFPQELRLESEILGLLAPHISKRTALELFSPVRDVDMELKRIEEESGSNIRVNLDEEDPPEDGEENNA